MKFGFSQQIFKKILRHQISQKKSMAAELLHTDGRTDITKRKVAFRNFANAPNKWNPNFSQKLYSHFIMSKKRLQIISKDAWTWLKTAETCSRLSFLITKCCVRSVFPKLTFVADRFWLRKMTMDPHILAQVSIGCLDERYTKLSIHISILISEGYGCIPVAYQTMYCMIWH